MGYLPLEHVRSEVNNTSPEEEKDTKKKKKKVKYFDNDFEVVCNKGDKSPFSFLLHANRQSEKCPECSCSEDAELLWNCPLPEKGREQNEKLKKSKNYGKKRLLDERTPSCMHILKTKQTRQNKTIQASYHFRFHVVHAARLKAKPERRMKLHDLALFHKWG